MVDNRELEGSLVVVFSKVLEVNRAMAYNQAPEVRQDLVVSPVLGFSKV